jgi:SAM-dependent methyltransferase
MASQIHPAFRSESTSTDEVMLKIANEADLRSEWMKTIFQKELKLTAAVHRKHWELAQIVNIVQKLQLCEVGKKGLVFAVGEERLPSLFAKYGCSVVATDMNQDDPKALAWKETNQHASSLLSLHYPDIVDEETFRNRVSYRPLDMNHIIDPDLVGQFDFVWSTCSIEHVGSILLGQRVVLNSLDLLKPGGTVIHTVEFNLGDLENTLDNKWPYVLWRKKDVEQVLNSVKALGYHIYPVSWAAGMQPWDQHVDVPPFKSWDHFINHPDGHIKLLLEGYVASSFLMVFTKPL